MGYEFTSYTTTEGEGVVEICAVITDPETGGATRQFSLVSSTGNGTAGLYIHTRVFLCLISC